MDALLLVIYALAVGLTLSGLAASLLELAKGAHAGFRPPFVERGRLVASFGATAAAGPYMLGNEALAAWREGIIGRRALALWTVVAGLWALASGVLVVEVALAASVVFA